MAKKDQVVDIPEKDENITEIDVSDEMRGSFLEYAVSVIYARALPDARDGLKPVQRVGDIAGYSTMEVYADPENATGLSEMTIALDLKGARRLELEPARCDDPNCMADHGLTGTSFPDDMTFRISAAADGQDALDEAMVFVDHLARLMGTRSE